MYGKQACLGMYTVCCGTELHPTFNWASMLTHLEGFLRGLELGAILYDGPVCSIEYRAAVIYSLTSHCGSLYRS